MKKSLITILLMTSFFCYSQTIDHAQLEVMYRYENVNNTLEPEKRTTDEVILLIGSKYTGYFSWKNYVADSLRRTNRAEYGLQLMDSEGRFVAVRAGEDFDAAAARGGLSGTSTIIPPRNMPSTAPLNRAQYLTNRKSTEVICMEHIVDLRALPNAQTHYISYTEILKKPVWKISTETDQIAGYRSQKAITRYGGRDWIVWFTHEIPVSEGPWKLRGLPGLILKAETADGEFSLTATSVSRSTNRPIVKDENNIYRNMPKKEFIKLKTEGFKNPYLPFEYNHIETLN
ncbi:MAG: GLPGLI family protein [Bacteroidales bacterium]|nr:GLPGLI family protein [Bacteroidales bacterium]